MIPGHAEVRTIARDHRTVDDGRALLDDVGREDRHVGLVDDRRGQYGSERPVVRDREGRAADVGAREPARAARASALMRRAIPKTLSVSASRITGTRRPCSSRSTAMPRWIASLYVIVFASGSRRALSAGKATRASTTARAMNGR